MPRSARCATRGHPRFGGYKQRNRSQPAGEPNGGYGSLSFRLLRHDFCDRQARHPNYSSAAQYLGRVSYNLFHLNGRPPTYYRGRRPGPGVGLLRRDQRSSGRNTLTSSVSRTGFFDQAPTLSAAGALRRQPWRQQTGLERYAGRRSVRLSPHCPPTATARSSTPPGTARCSRQTLATVNAGMPRGDRCTGNAAKHPWRWSPATGDP